MCERRREKVQYHIMRFIVNSKDDFGVINKAAGKLSPEFLKLFGSGCGRIGGVANDLYNVQMKRSKSKDSTYASAKGLIGWIAEDEKSGFNYHVMLENPLLVSLW